MIELVINCWSAAWELIFHPDKVSSGQRTMKSILCPAHLKLYCFVRSQPAMTTILRAISSIHCAIRMFWVISRLTLISSRHIWNRFVSKSAFLYKLTLNWFVTAPAGKRLQQLSRNRKKALLLCASSGLRPSHKQYFQTSQRSCKTLAYGCFWMVTAIRPMP